MNNDERKNLGLIYDPFDPDMVSTQIKYKDLLYEYNALKPSQIKEKQLFIKKIFAEAGEGCCVETPIHSSWGCHNVHLGNHTYLNTNVTLVDDADIYLGDYVKIAPGVVIATAGHPILPELRKSHVYASSIHIEDNVWIGSNATILPGVTIGENAVIGAGSVVTHDIPANVVAYGNPCEVVRPIGEKDRLYYFKDKKLDL